MRFSYSTTLLVLFFNISFGYSQNLSLSSMFCDHMVLQRDVLVPVWGKAMPNEKITVTFASQNKTVIAEDDGKWMIKLSPLAASKEGRKMIVSGSSTLEILDVVVGEVWICSGQSNMQMHVNAIPDIKALIPKSKNIRSFEVKRTVSYEEEENVTGEWAILHPSSAVAFSFAYSLELAKNIPIGIIHSSWGSSSIEAWMPRDMAGKLPYFNTIMTEFYADTLTQKRIHKAIVSPEGWNGKEDVFMRRQPNILYNAMMKPLAPYACRGLIWYQGERNTRYLSKMPEYTKDRWFHRVSGMKEYGEVLKLWIQRYRKEWNNNQMHFMVIMLPGYGKGTVKNQNIDPQSPTEESFAWMRESQLKALELPHTSVVNTIDLGDVDNIHPKDKLPIGKRLALLARRNTLGENIVAQGPKMHKTTIQRKKIVVHFDNAKGLKTNNSKTPSGFWIADASFHWKPAKAKIKNQTIVLKSRKIKHPLYVRYAFVGMPIVNLVNGSDLPAYPFRTDSN